MEQQLRERFAEMERKGMLTSVDALRRQQAELRAQAARLAEAIGMAGEFPSLIERLRSVESEISALGRTIAAYRPVNCAPP
jgi:flagellar motor component MotA